MAISLRIDDINRLGAVTSFHVDGHDKVINVQISKDASDMEGNPNWAKEQGILRTKLDFKSSGEASYVEMEPKALGPTLESFGFDPESIATILQAQKHAAARRAIFEKNLTAGDIEDLAKTEIMPPAKENFGGVTPDGKGIAYRLPDTWGARMREKVTAIMERGGR